MVLNSGGYWGEDSEPPANQSASELGQIEDELAVWLAPENYWRWLKYQYERNKVGGEKDGEVNYPCD